MSEQLRRLETAPQIGKELERLLEKGHKVGNFDELREKLLSESKVWDPSSFRLVMTAFVRANEQKRASDRKLGLPDVEIHLDGPLAVTGNVDQVVLNGVQGGKKQELFETQKHRQEEVQGNFRKHAYNSIAEQYNQPAVQLDKWFRQLEKNGWVGSNASRDIDSSKK